MTEPTNRPEDQPENPPPDQPEQSDQPEQPSPPPAAGYAVPPPMPYAAEVPPPPVAPKNGLGTAALVLAIIGLLFCWTVAGGIILGVLAVVLGFIGRGRAKRGEATNGGVALAGIVLGFLSILAGLVFIALFVWTFSFFGGDELADCLSEAGADQAAQEQCVQEFTENIETQINVTLTPAP